MTAKTPSSARYQDWLPFVARLLFAATFLYAGGTKLLSPAQDFADSIATFQLFPPVLINSIAVGIPMFEILAAALVLLPRGRRIGLLALIALTIAFIGVLAYAAYWHLPIDCGCFGPGANTTPAAGIVRNLLLVLVGSSLYWREGFRPSAP